MNIFEYVSKFAKNIGKSQILVEINVTRDELNNTTLNILNNSLEWVRRDDSKLISAAYRRDRDDLIKDFGRTGYLRSSNPFEMVFKSLTNALELLTFVEGYFTKNLHDDVTAASITLSKANALQLLDLIGFATRYTRSWIEIILSAESNHHSQVMGLPQITQQQIKFLSDNRDAFGRAIAILATPVKQVEKMMDQIPEIVIAEANPKAIQATQGNDRVDPLRMGLVQSKWDPIYLMGMVVSDFQVQRYKVAKEEQEMLELRILRLKRQLDNKDDPKLSDILDKRQGQLDKVRGKLKRMEDDLK